MTPEQLDTIGALADRADNLAHGAKLPLPPLMHVEMLSLAMEEIRDALRQLYKTASGTNPWEDQP